MIKSDRMGERFVLLALVLLFISIRLVAWSQTVVLENHDSVNYLVKAQAFSELDFEEVWDGYPDFLPAYSLATGFLSLIFGDVEFSARLCSLLFSTLLFFSSYKLARLYLDKLVSSVALLLMAINPTLTQLSISVLTEPMYISISVTGLYLFLRQVELASVKWAMLLGIIFGVSFLTRAEGIMFLLVIPFFQLLHYLFFRPRGYTSAELVKWSVSYMLIFCFTIAPQIIAVSAKIGEPALNGRQVWSKILKSNPEKTYEEKLYGIDYDPGKINLKYLQENPDKIDTNYGSVDFNVTLKHMYNEAQKFFRYRLTTLLHWSQLLFLPFGLIAILAHRSNLRKLYVSFSLIGFASVCMVPPLWHNVDLRHVAIITPVLILVAALGVALIADLSKKISPIGFDRKVLGSVFAILLVAAQSNEISSLLRTQKVQMAGYNHEEMLEIASVIRSNLGGADPASFVIASRKNFIRIYTGMTGPWVPYANWSRSKRYWKLHGADFVLLREHAMKGHHPIFQSDEYLNVNDKDFKLIWTKERDVYGKSIFLYKAIY